MCPQARLLHELEAAQREAEAAAVVRAGLSKREAGVAEKEVAVKNWRRQIREEAAKELQVSMGVASSGMAE